MNGETCFRLNGKTALITGGRGLYGKPITEGLCEAGATVVIASRDAGACQSYAEELNSRGYRAFGVALDLGNDASIESLAGWVRATMGHVDILINNAVNRAAYEMPGKLTRDNLNAAQNINIAGTMLLTDALLPDMISAGGGSIINISSIQGVRGPHFPYYEPGQSSPPSYTIEKWGIVGYTKWLAGYYGKHQIRVNCISPGGYNPPLKQTHPAFYSTYMEHTPLGKWPDEDDIKGPIIFLASEASRYVTGQNLIMDGGFTSW